MTAHDVAVHHQNQKQTYIVTQSLFDHISVFEKVGLAVPDKRIIDEVEDELLERIESNFAKAGLNIGITPIPFRDLRNEMLSLAHKAKKSFPNALVISSVPLIAYEAGGICIEMNRLINSNGDIISIGPRPGNPSIAKQTSIINTKAAGKPIVIMEDGSFSGGSLAYLLGLLNNRNAKVDAIVLGILFPEAERILTDKFDGELMHSVAIKNAIEWMPSHDFFPFIPNSGRVVGSFLGHTCFPVYLHNGTSLSMPYIMPYGDPEAWASLKGNIIALADFSRSCLRSTLKIFTEMERLNNRKITIGDLIHSYPRTSIPVSPGQYDFLALTERIVDILNGDLQFLS